MPGIIKPFKGIMPKIHPDAFVAETAVVIGDVEIGAGASVWYGCVLRGEVNLIRIGRDTNLQDGTIVHGNHDPNGDYRETGGGMATHIGDEVTVGHMAVIHACRVESRCFIGMRAVVMDEAKVEREAMVAAGALVSPGKVVKSGQLWAGMPAKHRRDLSREEMNHFTYSAKHYARLAAQYLARNDD